ncbi:hypothetical protein HN615_14940 [Candidatus Woesearchaeota archaeon]|jgi:uncharacterized protein (UPF0333 family)|nr:hypothetical protein [Candidatus Woesearchaeota archaeon]
MDWLQIKTRVKKPLKIIGYIALVWVILAIISGSYVGIKALQDKSQRNKIEIKVEYNIEACKEEKPLAILIKNSSNKTVNSVAFDIEIRRKGYSNNLAKSSYLKYKTDKILAPDEVNIVCGRYELARGKERYDNPEELDFSIAEYKNIKFKE